MNEQLLIELFGAIASIVTSYSLVNWRLKKLEEKVDKHNAWGEKFQAQTTDVKLIQKDIEYIRKQIESKG